MKVASALEEPSTRDGLLGLADRRYLYTAKEAGRNRSIAGGDAAAGREHVYGA